MLVAALGLVPSLALGSVTWFMFRVHLGGMLGEAAAVRDYLNLWGAGMLALTGRLPAAFHPQEFQGWLQDRFGPDVTAHSWSYPPTMLFIAVPFAALPIVPGFVIWGAGSLALLRGLLRRAGLPSLACLAIVLSPAAMENVLAGQNGALTASLLEGGLLLLPWRPVMAGVLFGLLTAKPQLGLLVPVCLVAAGAWPAVAAAVGTAIVLTLASGLSFGWDCWVLFLTEVREFMTVTVLARPFGATFQTLMATPFILIRWLDAPLAVAYAGQAVASLGCAAIVWRTWRLRNADPVIRVALTAALAPLATPYAYNYDTIGVGIAVVALIGRARETGFLPFERWLLGVAWMWPGCAFWFGIVGMPPIGCLTLAGVAFCAARRLGPWTGVLATHSRGIAARALLGDTPADVPNA